MAEVREGEVAAEQMRRKSDAANRSDTGAVADKYLIMSEIMICPVWFCLIVSALSATVERP